MGVERVFIGQRSAVASGQMASLAVREHVEVFKHRPLAVRVRVKILQIHGFGLKGMKAARRDGVVPTVAPTAHTRLNPVLRRERIFVW